MIWIEIKDDGKGIDVKRVTDLALQKGLITREQLAGMSDNDKLNFIFLPGFSTAKSVTKISGRGVGMDVVKSMITAFNGLIDIDTIPGKGTSFVLKIPLSLASLTVLLAQIEVGTYAFPVDSIVELIHIVPGQVHSLGVTGVIRLRDEVIRILDMERVMGLKTRRIDKRSSADVIIISDGTQKMGVVVDRVVGQAEVVLKPVPPQCASSQGVAGTAILGDGTVTVILDPLTILKIASAIAGVESKAESTSV
jgi:two-component system chemotaxis sensor kinase CheA